MAVNNFKFAQLQPFSLFGGGAVSGDTSITLKSMLDINGNALSMSADFGTIGFGTLEPGNGALEEQISFTGLSNNANGTTTLTGVSSVTFLYPYTATSGLSKTHAGSTTFVISNTSGFYNKQVSKDDDATITATYTFTNPLYPRMDTDSPFPTDDNQLATKGYADSLAFAGAPDASTTVKGLVQLPTQAQTDARTTTGSTGAKLAITPDVVRSTLLSDYVADTGAADAYVITPVPSATAYTVGQIFSFKAAHTNTTTSTVNVSALGVKTIKKASGNNLVAGDILAGQIVMIEYDGTNFQLVSDVAPDPATQVGVQNSSYVYAATSSGTDAYAITVSPVVSAYAVGQVFYFKTDVANTGAASLNVSGLGAKTIKKRVSVDLSTNDILAGQTVQVQYDGTNFQIMSPQAIVFLGLYGSGKTSYDLSTASGVQNIPHGLGFVPVSFNVIGTGPVSAGTPFNGAFSLNGNSINGTVGGSSDFTILGTDTSNKQNAVVTADATNIILTWTKSGSPTGAAAIVWSAFV